MRKRVSIDTSRHHGNAGVIIDGCRVELVSCNWEQVDFAASAVEASSA